MSTDIVVANSQEDYSREKIELIKRTIAVGATDDELQLFLYTARRTGLDPLARQIHMVKRWNSAAGREVAAIQTGIDGYRLIADRTGKLASIGDAVYDDESGPNPGKATVTVEKIVDGEARAFTASARWSEYCQVKKEGSPVSMWVKMPYLMLGKCAEALALRKAFPADLSGVYTFEEMGQADNPSPDGGKGQKPPVQQPQRASDKAKQAEQSVQGQQPQGEALETISGTIDTAKVGNKGNSMWLKVGGHLMVADEAVACEEMVEGNYLSVKVRKANSAQIGDYFRVVEVLECSVVQDGQAEESPTTTAAAPETAAGEAATTENFDKAVEPLPEEGKSVNPENPLQGLFNSGAVKKGSDVPSPEPKKEGTIGLKRAQRIHTLITQNHKKTGFTEDVLKGLMAQIPLEHLRDLPEDMHAVVEAYALGEKDWRTGK